MSNGEHEPILSQVESDPEQMRKVGRALMRETFSQDTLALERSGPRVYGDTDLSQLSQATNQR